MEYAQKKSHPTEIVEVEDDKVVVKKIKRTPANIQRSRDHVAAPSERGLSRSSSDYISPSGFDNRGMEPMGGDVEQNPAGGPGAPIEGGYV